MDQTHIGYTYWQEPRKNTMPRVDVIPLPIAAEMGVAVVEENRAPPPRGLVASRELSLPAFDPYTRPTYHIDVYDRGQTAFAFTASAAEPWIVVSPAKGTITRRHASRSASIGRKRPSGANRVPITITGPKGAKTVVQAPVDNPASPTRDSVSGFIETNGLISIDAEHFSREVAPTPFNWLRVPSLGGPHRSPR